MAKFLDPRTGKMVEFHSSKNKNSSVKKKPKKRFLTLQENVIEEDDVISGEIIEEEEHHNENPLNKRFVNTAQFIDFIVKLLERRRVEEACDIYAHSQEDIGYLLINRLSNKKQSMKYLANMFFKSRDYSKAAIVCEHIDAYDKAAFLYEKSDDHYMAAECYIKIGDKKRAAEMFEKSQNYTEAANLFTQLKNYERAAFNYEKAVNVFLAGKLYFQVKNFKKSMELLQKIEVNNEHFLEATKMISGILSENGYLDLAIRKLEAIKSSVGLTEETEDIYFKLGKTYLEANDVKNGKEILLELKNYDFYYEGLEPILRQLNKGINPFYAEDIEIEIDIEEVEEVQEHRESGYVSVMEGFEYLSTLPIFSELSLGELKSLYNISETVKFDAGEYLIVQNQPGQGLFIIRDGDIDIVDESGDVPKVIVTLEEGVHVGEMTLVDDSKTSASVVAKTDVLAFKIDKKEFNKLLSSNDKIARKIYLVFIKTLSERLRTTNEKVGK